MEKAQCLLHLELLTSTILIFRHPFRILQLENHQIFLDQDTSLVIHLISAVAICSLEDHIDSHADFHRRAPQHRERASRRMKP